MNNQSQKILNSYKRQIEKESLQKKIDELNTRWVLLRKKSLEIRSRLESNSSQWSALLGSLNELIIWCKNQYGQVDSKIQTVQADPVALQKQINDFKVKKRKYTNKLKKFKCYYVLILRYLCAMLNTRNQ